MVWQVNSIPGAAALDRKDRLWNNYSALRAKLGRRVVNFIPETYNLPEELVQGKMLTL